MENTGKTPIEDPHAELLQDIQDLKLALKHIRREGDLVEEINTINEIGNLHCKMHKHEEGLGYFFEALQVALGFERNDLESITRFYIAMAYMNTDNMGAAEFELEQALPYFEASDHPQLELVREKLNQARSKS